MWSWPSWNRSTSASPDRGPFTRIRHACHVLFAARARSAGRARAISRTQERLKAAEYHPFAVKGWACRTFSRRSSSGLFHHLIARSGATHKRSRRRRRFHLPWPVPPGKGGKLAIGNVVAHAFDTGDGAMFAPDFVADGGQSPCRRQACPWAPGSQNRQHRPSHSPAFGGRVFSRLPGKEKGGQAALSVHRSYVVVQTSSSMRCGSSRFSFTRTRKVTASRPSTRRWS